ncbi:unnamed protein product [Lactuca virosa]|uniref:Uncharacterized protein n=1 Tax=Lactuca virosa TaxID=75947 RepID=A0AAU9NWR6_9ASTR|nr:unnamed protein product [Lactuca virosa]
MFFFGYTLTCNRSVSTKQVSSCCCYSWYLFLAWYAAQKHWLANNILGLAFCIQGIEMLSLGSFKTGAILLAGLFVYDIFWVFFTPVMVSVAKSFDAPIKLLFPSRIAARPFSMLGLGDIVIPGIFVALALRFDVSRGRESHYFKSAFLGYTVGLVLTIVVMNWFQAAQGQHVCSYYSLYGICKYGPGSTKLGSSP